MKTLERYGTVLRVYDNGGKTIDRYTILPPRWAGDDYKERGWWYALASSDNPFYPTGFGMHVTAEAGHHLGKRIHWDSLPNDVKRFAMNEWPEFTGGVNND